MRIIVCENYEEVSKKAAQMILSQVTLKPNSVLGLATEMCIRDRCMVVKNKLAWSSIEAVNRDFGSCLYDLQNFKMLYTKEDMPALWERYIKEGFKNYMVSFLELTKAMLYYKTIDLNIKSKNFYDYLLACEYHNLLPKNSAIVIETLRKLRNDDSHGYDIPEFEEMYELFTENEDVFVNIRNSCNSNL